MGTAAIIAGIAGIGAIGYTVYDKYTSGTYWWQRPPFNFSQQQFRRNRIQIRPQVKQVTSPSPPSGIFNTYGEIPLTYPKVTGKYIVTSK